MPVRKDFDMAVLIADFFRLSRGELEAKYGADHDTLSRKVRGAGARGTKKFIVKNPFIPESRAEKIREREDRILDGLGIREIARLEGGDPNAVFDYIQAHDLHEVWTEGRLMRAFKVAGTEEDRISRIMRNINEDLFLSRSDRTYLSRHREVFHLWRELKDEKKRNAFYGIADVVGYLADISYWRSSPSERRAVDLLRDFSDYKGDRNRLFRLAERYLHYESEGVEVSARRLGGEVGLSQPSVNPLLKRIGLKKVDGTPRKN